MAESEVDPEPPCEIEIEAGFKAKEKSAAGGGGGPCDPPPPQAQRNIPRETTRQEHVFREGENEERAEAVFMMLGRVPSVNANAQDARKAMIMAMAIDGVKTQRSSLESFYQRK
ncbi:MAG: hypothetical protein DMG55_05490 [Acidobacteria bacterium]|nr:MAG: hypothetical protein DMG55_05490 [Acidobacteriota bacterium]